MASVKLSDVITKYEDKEKSGDLAEWMDKLELVAKLQNISDLVTLVPLFLTGPAFAVYKQLGEEDKADYKKLKQKLIQCFGIDSFIAYEMLQRRVLQDEETVDVYVADLKRLAGLMGMAEESSEPLLRCAFVAGLPADTAIQLKSIVAVENLNLTELVSRARMILSVRRPVSNPCAVGQSGTRRQVTCYGCGETGHISTDCPKRKGKVPAYKKPVCFECGELGHIKRYCKGKVSGEKKELQGNE